MNQTLHSRRYRLKEATVRTEMSEERIVQYIEEHWVHPNPGDELDEEDVARARLIAELQSDFGVNDEAIPIILDLLDQVHRLRRALAMQQQKRL